MSDYTWVANGVRTNATVAIEYGRVVQVDSGHPFKYQHPLTTTPVCRVLGGVVAPCNVPKQKDLPPPENPRTGGRHGNSYIMGQGNVDVDGGPLPVPDSYVEPIERKSVWEGGSPDDTAWGD